MLKSTAAAKPQKPHEDFPLYAHGCGQWAKKIKGRLRYFGPWRDDRNGQKAIQEWLRQKDDLLAGHEPRSKTQDGLTLDQLRNEFLTAKEIVLDSGDLSPRTFVGYKQTTSVLVETFGRTRLVTDLRPTDFTKLYSKLSRKHGPATLGREVAIIRSVFKFGYESDLIERVVKFGPLFKAPDKAKRRKAKAKQRHTNGKKMFQADEVRAMLAAAGPQLKAMILLGVNGGLGNSDCSRLTLADLDLKGGWLDLPREKTGIHRRIPLWKETVEALQAVIDAIPKRIKPRDPAHADLVFLTRCGQLWCRYDLEEVEKANGKFDVRAKAADAVATGTLQLLKALKLKRPGLSFYALRHTFETIAGGCRDQVAVDAIMGHVDPTMASEYREHIEDERLLAAVNHVRSWLYGAETA